MIFNRLLLLLTIFVPMGTGVFLFLIPKRVKWIREFFSILATLLPFGALIFIFFFLKESNISLHYSLLSIGNFSLDLKLQTDPLNLFMLLFLTGFGFLFTLYSLRYMAEKDRRKEYYIFMLIAVGSSCGVLLANHLLLFLIFWELVSVSLYFLITTGTPLAGEGATKTFGIIGASDACLLLGIGLVWYLTKSSMGAYTLVMKDIHLALDSWLSYVAYILIMIGALTKAGSMPFHTWIPSASKGAPASVMALLPASIDKLLGIYLTIVLTTQLFVKSAVMGMVLMSIGAVTVVCAVMMALVQHELPKLLSYHAISQVGYMVLGIGTMNPLGIAGGLFHMLNHSIYKSCLFLCNGAVEHKTKTNELAKLGGLAGAMPVTFIACMVAAFSISGVPPFNGFASKWMIYQGTIEAGGVPSFFFLIAAMFGSALTLASFIKVLYSVFLGQKSKTTEPVKKDVGFSMQLPMIILALLCIVFGVFFFYPLAEFIYPAIPDTVSMEGTWESGIATILILAGIVAGLFIYFIGRAKKSARKVNTFIGGEELETESIRVPGTDFYNTIRNTVPLRAVYNRQEKGWFDPYIWFGGIGGLVTKFLRVLHNGRLSFYLAWALIGIGVFILLMIYPSLG